jgi:uncharacterized repeat protein (TIGR01451 family)
MKTITALGRLAAKNFRHTVTLVCALIFLVGLQSQKPASAHGAWLGNGQFDFTAGTLTTLQSNVDAGLGGFQNGDFIEFTAKFPVIVNGTLSGPGGYLTTYVPPGTQVTGAWIVDAAGIPINARPSTAITTGEGTSRGWGPLLQNTYNVTANGWVPSSTATCTADGYTTATCDAGLAYIYGDTGIFYSTRADTAVFANGQTAISLTNGYLANPTNGTPWTTVGGSGSERLHNKWDTVQSNAFGSAAPVANGFTVAEETALTAAPAANKGRGATPFNAGSPVAGPDSGSPWDRYGTTGPWNRISYPGSCFADDSTIAGSEGPANGAGSVVPQAAGAAINSVNVCTPTTTGVTLSDAAPLPTTTNAIRIAVGGIESGQTYSFKIRLKVTNASLLGVINYEGHGGDSSQGVKASNDNPWRYWVGAPAFAPLPNARFYINKSIVSVNGGAYNGTSIPPGATVRYLVTYANGYAQEQTNVVLSDILPTQATSTANFIVISGPNIIPAVLPSTGTFNFQTIPTLLPGHGGSIAFDVVTNATVGQTVTGTARINSTQVPTLKTSAVSTVVALQSSITLTETSIGGVSDFSFNGDNGFGPDIITTATSGVGVAGVVKTLAVVATPTTITQTIPLNYTLTAASCSGLGAGGTAIPDLVAGTITLNAAATVGGTNIACSFTNTKIPSLPTIKINTISNGGVTAFPYSGDNGYGSDTVTTLTSGVGVGGVTKTLAVASTSTTITEAIPPGYVLTAANCTGLGAGGTATTDLLAGTIILDAAATAMSSDILCTYTNQAQTNLVTVVTLTSGNPTPTEGDTVSYLVKVTNNGPLDATNVLLTDQLPAGFTATVTNGTVDTGSYVAATGVWSIGNLNSGTSATLILSGTVNVGQAGAVIVDTATAGATSDQTDPTTVGDVLSVNITVTKPIVATDDSVTGINGITGQSNVLNVYGNDTLNGVPVVPADVTLTVDPTAPVPSQLTFNPVTGQVDVNSGTPGAAYSFNYKICENADPANCDPATVTITVTNPIVANDDNVADINGITGQLNVLNAYGNDTLNGAPVVPADVTLTVDPTTPVPSQLTFNPVTGQIDVPVGTTGGLYSFNYTICETAAPTNCDPAIVTITVIKPIVATDDSATGINGITGQPNVLNAYGNDTLNGAPVVPADVTLTVDPTTPVPSQLTFNPVSGQVDVNPGTPGAAYSFNYKICETADPANCDPAIVTITVTKPIVANDDNVAGINGITGQLNVVNAYGNDTLNGVPVVPAQVTLTVDPTTPVPSQLTFNPVTGQVDVNPGTPGSTYTFSYTICEISDPANCDLATMTVTVFTPTGTVTGTMFIDLNGNGIFDGSDTPAGSGYVVEVVDAGNTVAGSSITDGSGSYSITAPVGSGYTILFKVPSGGIIGSITNVTVSVGVTVIDQNQPIDPSGIVYDSVTRQPVAGATVMITDGIGNALPTACLINPAQQNQVTDASGQYRFDLVLGGAACPLTPTEYDLVISVPPGYAPSVSTQLPPQSGALDVNTCPVDAVPGGSCQMSASPVQPASGAAFYFMRFLIATGAADLVNNHIPIDPIIAPASFTKTTSVSTLRRGEKVAYVIQAKGVSFSPARIVDVMPVGFAFVEGTAQVNGIAVTPVTDGRKIIFDGLAPDGSQVIRVDLTLVATAAVATGPQINVGKFVNPATGAVIAKAQAIVELMAEPMFDCGDLIGKVFDDKNRDGYQNEGEPGLPGVRLATARGLLVTTDQHGRFHVACADLPDPEIGSNFTVKLDTRTLPVGYHVTTDNPYTVRLTRGKVTKLNFGVASSRLINVDFKDKAFVGGSLILSPEWAAQLDRLLGLLDDEPSTLQLTYYSGSQGQGLANKRLTAIENLINKRREKRSGQIQLLIETRVIVAN